MSTPESIISTQTVGTIDRRFWIYALVLIVAVLGVYSRLLSAGFSGLDDDIHVYANPYLNPPTIEGIERLWSMPYRGLYVPLAYTLFAIIAHFSQTPATFSPSMGVTATVSPMLFHAVNIIFHAANVVLAFAFLRRLIKIDLIAFIASLIFALHPLQVESVAWIAELRGLSGSFFALVALNLFMYSRDLPDERKPLAIGLLIAATLAIVCGMLCKPSIVALPLVTLAIDRIYFQIDWRKSLTLASLWILCAIPFLMITHGVQDVEPQGVSQLWQRPFVAGDALAFYIGKTLLPINLCVDYGRTPIHLFTHWWCYVTWIIPAVGLALAYTLRLTRPLTWLGALIFVFFFLPVLGFVQFSFQNFSTVSDRYEYLPLLGVVLIIAESITFLPGKFGLILMSFVGVICAALSFYQTQFWMMPTTFLLHTLDVNPRAAFAYNNLGRLYSGDKEYNTALHYYLLGVKMAPGQAETDINTARCYIALGQPDNARAMVNLAETEPTINGDYYSDIGNILMQIGDTKNGLKDLALAVQMMRGKPSCLYNYGNGLLQIGDFPKAEAIFWRCIEKDPTMFEPHLGLGDAYARTGHIPEAQTQFAEAVALKPTDLSALQNLKHAQDILASQPSRAH